MFWLATWMHRTLCRKGTLLATITDPFGAFERKVNAPNDGYISMPFSYCLSRDAVP
jgi:hypothetical protein